MKPVVASHSISHTVAQSSHAATRPERVERHPRSQPTRTAVRRSIRSTRVRSTPEAAPAPFFASRFQAELTPALKAGWTNWSWSVGLLDLKEIIATLTLGLATWKACDLTVGIRLSKSLEQYVLSAPLRHRRPDFRSMGAHVARVWERASYWVEAGVRVRASSRATRSDRGEP
ncbi:hypothetical protein E6C27_scaffold597G00120 [Cucumis melo var. makuwa]|uniref:Ty3-gypsy retrotransposon protein n=1 Tax=Cucumis melo var. makuwa TaxID=1194695 RepID=A0A5A7T1Q3_CUCMM|nr:hypothetical protein E6C27_scaffold597G00120 [Cucumis melo var. makuwa]